MPKQRKSTSSLKTGLMEEMSFPVSLNHSQVHSVLAVVLIFLSCWSIVSVINKQSRELKT